MNLMTNNKTLFLILGMTFSPFLIAALLSSEYFSSQLAQKNNGEFVTTSTYLKNKVSPLHWHLVIQQDNNSGIDKIEKIKTALGKRSDLVDIIIVKDLDSAAYIATPEGQLLLSYQQAEIGKPLYQDLKHLLRSNSK
jgi:hypothetical protein